MPRMHPSEDHSPAEHDKDSLIELEIPFPGFRLTTICYPCLRKPPVYPVDILLLPCCHNMQPSHDAVAPRFGGGGSVVPPVAHVVPNHERSAASAFHQSPAPPG